jgi:hypothetical protein
MISLETSPEKYRHWKMQVEGDLAFLTMDVQEDAWIWNSRMQCSGCVLSILK